MTNQSLSAATHARIQESSHSQPWTSVSALLPMRTCRRVATASHGPQLFVNQVFFRALTGNSSPGSGRSPGGGNSNPLQYSCLENPMDREAWRAVHGVAKNWTRLSNFNFLKLNFSNFSTGNSNRSGPSAEADTSHWRPTRPHLCPLDGVSCPPGLWGSPGACGTPVDSHIRPGNHVLFSCSQMTTPKHRDTV